MSKVEIMWQHLVTSGVDLGKHILAAMVIYIVGRWLIKLINRGCARMMSRRNMDPEVHSFIASGVSIGLNILLIIGVIGALGIETTSLAALVASLGVAIGMALSGQMQNLAGGVLILIQRPYKIGDYIATNDVEGRVESIQIFNTRLLTVDNKTIYVPNGNISSGVLINYSAQMLRRIDLCYNVEYGENMEKIREVLQGVLNANEKVLKEPAYEILLEALTDSSVAIKIKAWSRTDDYWEVFYRLNEDVYNAFNNAGINFPFPQVTVHQA